MTVLTTLYNPLFVVLSVIVAIFASFVALDLARSVTQAKGRLQMNWLLGGALAMGFGIWSMHFIGMLAFQIPGVPMAYDIQLMILSILIAICASGLALFVVSRTVVTTGLVVAGGIAMAAAIAGMHYTGMYSMRMPAVIYWNLPLVILSIFIALIASYAALLIAVNLRGTEKRNRQFFASVIMGFAIAGMHYTGMTAATFVYRAGTEVIGSQLLASSGLAYAVLTATGLILGLAVVSVLIDRAFSRRTKIAEKMTRALNDLREERELRDRFVSALAHDLRTPLTVATISAQMMEQNKAPEMLGAHCVKMIKSLQRMDQMIQDLLDAQRMSAGQTLPLQIERCDVKELLVNTLQDLRTVYGERFELKCPNGLEAYWDSKYVRRMIENLCTNAIKYGKDGAPITIKAELNDDKMRLSVHNQGEPISQMDLENLFTLFHRSSSAEATGELGWGLGLTIVKGIAEAHSGSVNVESTPEGETAFFVDLPLRV